MRCRFKHKIFQNEENGYTIAIFTTQDTSVPLSARDKYLASRNIIGFSAIGFGLPLTDEIELEMEGRWESGEHGTQYQVENFMEVVPRTKEGILGYLSSGAVKGIGPKMAAFISMEFIKEQFEHVIYIYALTWQKVLIYFFTRGIILLGIVNIKKREESIRSMIEQCCGIIVITGALLCAVLFKYQLWLDEMANGSKPIRGINASMNLSAISLLIVLSGMFIIKYQVVKQEKTTLILRDQLLEERYAEMLKSRQMIHDMKNHLLVLRNMERANQWDKLHDYLEEISKDILDDSTKIWTGNNIVDLILNSKKKQADSEGIAFSIGSNMIGDVPFKDGETISLLGNLLDNAIEACERIKSTEKWVTIRINRRYCLLYIEIENSIEEHPKEKNHRLISCKSEKEVHGYGLKNVRQIVDRYDGTYSYQIKENSFLTCVSFFSNEDVS